MACTVNFSNDLPFECIMEIVADIRSSKLDLDTLSKALWVSGCATSALTKTAKIPEEPHLFEAIDISSIPDDVDHIANALEDCLPTTSITAWKPNPDNWRMILELLLKLLPLIVK